MGEVVDDLRVSRMIESDAAVSKNYQRLVSITLNKLYNKEYKDITLEALTDIVVGDLRTSVARLFPNLLLNSLGSPLENGTFKFDKGDAKQFEYQNLSGGEKAAFDLLLDIVVRRSGFSDAVYCIDEPEAHMNTRLQGRLLEEIYTLVPQYSQLWVATHSIGMMHKARELENHNPGSVIFLDFDGHDFDKPAIITPSKPTRSFWEKILKVALDDLADLVAPKEVIICEGSPSGLDPVRNAAHDARIYNIIFGDEFPDVKFLSGGSATEVTGDKLGMLAALPLVASGIKVRGLIDRDDRSSMEIADLSRKGITILNRRHLEAYLYDDEVLAALCYSVNKGSEITDLLLDKQAAISESVARKHPPDDIKSAAGDIYNKAKRRLGLTGAGNDNMSFARDTLAPLLKPGMSVYTELKQAIFGK